MLAIPHHKSRNKNRLRYGEGGSDFDDGRCLLCGKPVNGDTARMVRVGNGGLSLVTDREAEADPAGDLGWLPVGPDCWRRHPEIHPYGDGHQGKTCAVCGAPIGIAELCADCAKGNNPFVTSKYTGDYLP
jgi:hypothetical protein